MAKSGDELMRKASREFSRGRMEKAWRIYGDAVDAYRKFPDLPKERVALALYTRASLVVMGGVEADASMDLDTGRALVASAEGATLRRFKGLFDYLHAIVARRAGQLEEARTSLMAGKGEIVTHGNDADRCEVLLEEAELTLAEGRKTAAVETARKALEFAVESVARRCHVWRRIAEFHEAAGDVSEAFRAMAAARSVASDANRKDLQASLRTAEAELAARHPGVDLPDASPAADEWL